MKKLKKTISLMLALAVILSLFPLPAINNRITANATETNTISQFTITGVTEPAAGSTATTNGITVASGANYSISSACWYHDPEFTETFPYEFDGEFQPGLKYQIYITVSLNAGYTLGAEDTIIATINGKAASFFTLSEDSIIIYYNYSIFGRDCNIYFDANGATGSMTQKTCTENTMFKFPTHTFIPAEGCEFDCWEVNGTTFNPGDTITVTSDLTIKAIWAPIETFTVNFVLNGHGEKINTISGLKRNSKLAEPVTPIDESGLYSFQGWYTDIEFKDSYDFSKPIKSDITLYAKWVYIIKNITITNVNEPIPGKSASFDTLSIPEDSPYFFNEGYPCWYYDTSENGDFDTPYTGENFEDGYYYQLWCELTPDDGYCFALDQDITATINGVDAVTENNYETGSIYMWITYTCNSSVPLSVSLTANGESDTLCANIGDNIELKPVPKSGVAPYTYQYLMQNVTTGTTMTLKDYSTSAKYTGLLSSGGVKIFTVNVKDSTGTVVASNAVTVKVYPTLKAVLKVNGGTGTIKVEKGKTVSLKTTVVGGDGKYMYMYLMRNVTTDTSLVLKTYTSSSTYTGSIISYGTKILTVNVVDGTGQIVSTNSVTVISDPASPLVGTLKVNGATGTVNLAKGEKVTLTSSASGGTGAYTYQYLMKTSASDKPIVLKDYSTDTSFVGPLTSTGLKIFTINVKDAKGTIVASNSVNVVVSESVASLRCSLKVNGNTDTITLAKGDNVNLVPTAAGGTGPYTYQYLMKTSTSGNNVVLKNYSSSTSFTGPLTSTGTKIFTVNVKDSKGTVVATNSVTVVVVDSIPTVSLKVNDSTGTITLNKGVSVTLTPLVSGSTAPYTYQYVMKNVNAGTTHILKDYGTSTSYTGPLTSAGTKIFTVNVKDSKGTVVTTNSVTVVVK